MDCCEYARTLTEFTWFCELTKLIEELEFELM